MERIVVVSKSTRLEELVREHLTLSAAKFHVESLGQSIADYLLENATYKESLAEIRKQIPNDIAVVAITRENLPDFLFRKTDLVIVCGPDGLFVNVAKYLDAQPVLTVNPDKKTVAGVLMLFEPKQVGNVIKQVRDGKHKVQSLPFVRACIDNDQIIWGINDIFIGRKDHGSARYKLSYAHQEERQSSSGIIVSTGVGGTGWMRSVQVMIAGIAGKSSGKLATLPQIESNELVFVVREPFPSPSTGISMITGRITPGKPLTVISEMPDGGCIFSDGILEKAVVWNAGSSVVISVGDRHVNRIIP
jgi:NAD kinase